MKYTLPLLRPSIVVALIFRTITALQTFDIPYTMTGGGPGNSTTLLSIDLVKIALGQFDLGPAAAMSLIYFAITLFASWLFYTLMTRNDAE